MLAGCASGSTESDKKSDVASTPDASVTVTTAPTDAPAATETPVPTDTPAPTSTPVPTDAPVPTNTPAPTAETAKLTRDDFGRVVDNCFYSKMLHLKCELVNAWKFLSDEEINTLSGISLEKMYNENFWDEIKDNAVQAMYAMSLLNGGDSITVGYVKADGMLAVIDEKTYAGMIAPVLVSGYETAGMTEVTYDVTEILFAGEKKTCLKIAGLREGTEMHEVSVFNKVDGFKCIISVVSFGSDRTDNLLAYFKPFEGPIPEAKAVITPETKPYSVGVLNGTEYSNEFLGIRFDAGADATFTDKTTLLETLGLNANATDKEYNEAARKSDGANIFKASYNESGISVTIGTENLGDLAVIIGEELYLQIVFEGLQESLKAYGVTVSDYDIADIDFAGEEHFALLICYQVSGINVYQLHIAVKSGEHMAFVLLNGYDEDLVLELIDEFKPY